MLLDSPRLKPGDREHWQHLERYDHAIGAHLGKKAARAVAEIQRWADQGGHAVCSVSWGKDSTVVAHLTHLAGVDIPVVWVRSDPWEMPECEQVRDALLARCPGLRYEERVAKLRNPKRGQVGYEQHHLDPESKSQDVLGELIPERYISGVRAEESRMRAQSARWHGVSTRNTCRPILRWSAEEVFGYLAVHDLPVHPAYAMTYGGRRDRRWLRVHPLCSYHEESGVHGDDAVTWEDDYYGTAIAQALRRAHET